MTTSRRCSVEGCDRAYSCRGLCASHYERARVNGTIPIRKLQPARHATLYMYQKGCRCDGCREAAIESDRKWRLKNPEAHRRRNRSRNMKKAYGLTVADYDALLAAQDGKCAICGVEPGVKESSLRKHLCVDHCHTTGKIRGLLCGPCNRALGLLGENPQTVAAAQQYLLAHSTEAVL